MITTKYNFKQRMSKKYPDIAFIPIYGTNAYMFDKELDAVDMYEYNVTQLTNGKYVCFIGSISLQLRIDTIKQLNEGKTPATGKRSYYAPTTFTTFESYLLSKGVQYIHRTHIQEQSANEALFTDKDDPAWGVKRNWYMYEIPKDSVVPNPATPYIETENGTMVLLIKSSNSTYISKKKLFMQKFTRMQPIYEQIIAACATEDWERAVYLCNQYVSIQFDQTLSVKDIGAMKEAYANGLLRVYTRTLENFEVAQDDETL